MFRYPSSFPGVDSRRFRIRDRGYFSSLLLGYGAIRPNSLHDIPNVTISTACLSDEPYLFVHGLKDQPTMTEILCN